MLYSGNRRLKIGLKCVYSPDLMVVSQPNEHPAYEEYPGLIVEIATWETDRTDRGEKLLMYQNITGVVSGTPTAASAAADYTITATDANGATATYSITFVVNP